MLKSREAAVAGMFYAAQPERLREDITLFLEHSSRSEKVSGIRALVVPHAGYPYSGGVAAEAFSYLRGAAYKRVILLGASHRVWLEGVSVAPYVTYATPLGDLPVDRNAAEVLLACGAPFFEDRRAHQMEHSLEVQLPWLQHLLKPGFSILPILIGAQDEAGLRECGRILHKEFYDPGTLFICSTDLSHDHPYDEAVTMDNRVRDALAQRDSAALIRLFDSGEGEACGRMALLVLLFALAEEDLAVAITGCRNSGDVVGDRDSRIVGYLSALIREVGNAG